MEFFFFLNYVHVKLCGATCNEAVDQIWPAGLWFDICDLNGRNIYIEIYVAVAEFDLLVKL